MRDEFSSLLTVGFCIMILLNIFINIGMNLGALPVTGVPLPLVSYGGSSVLVNLIGLGLIQAARRRISIKDVSAKIAFDPSGWK
jgi:rod shape determining protein RodA